MKRGDKHLNAWVEYGESKWGDVALAKYVDEHYGPRSGNPNGEVISIAVHPGIVRTGLYKYSTLSTLMNTDWIARVFYITPLMGALNQIWTGAMPTKEAREISGEYIVPYQTVTPARPDLEDPAKWDELWKWCDEQAIKSV